ncbi:hypothetical protein LWI28_023556 [Acer negundo]|uniref:Terpene synthase N-terminal domain-containing protein n=1 Tax=Acer negundo TaxID=4023 RepID=A0AAD5IVK5_ACENE|nr:hypothetical protein LWI28_023556 [Acer negundo]
MISIIRFAMELVISLLFSSTNFVGLDRLLPSLSTTVASKVKSVQRRSANYHPSIWNHELIDSLSTPYQRLGVAYHFEEEIKEALNLHLNDVMITTDLHETSLQFRLLREHGHSISSGNVSEQVQQSLEIPLHWRMPRVEALNFINLYTTEYDDDHNSLVLLELAKLDYN